MHAGNIFAALNAWLIAKSQGGTMVLRIEDLDAERSRREYADGMMRHFEMLGLTWDEGPYFQHDREEAYRAAFDAISKDAHVYPCFCSRADLNAQSAPHRGEKQVYSGKCRHLSCEDASRMMEIRHEEGRDAAWRLEVPDLDVSFDDLYQGPVSQNLESECGDFLIRRSDGGFAYQLAVVVDDAEQGITSVSRGYDLLVSTPQQIYLQRLLGHDSPQYAHFPLFVALDGRRLAKRNRDCAFDALLDEWKTPERALGHIAYVGGLQECDGPTSPEELLKEFDPSKLDYRDRVAIVYDSKA